MKKKTESWGWEIKLLCQCAVIFAVTAVLASILGGKNFWASQIALMKSQPVYTIVAIAWIVGVLISGLLLRRWFFARVNRLRLIAKPQTPSPRAGHSEEK